MTAQRKFETKVTPTTTDMFDGEHVEMFSSGSAPKTIAQSGAGEAVEMFSSGSTPTTSSTVIGDLTALFSSGS